MDEKIREWLKARREAPTRFLAQAILAQEQRIAALEGHTHLLWVGGVQYLTEETQTRIAPPSAASSPPATESPTKASPSAVDEYERLNTLRQRLGREQMYTEKWKVEEQIRNLLMASTTPPIPVSSLSAQDATPSGPVVRGSGCAHVARTTPVNRWWDRCRKCDVWMWFELTPVPAAAPTTSTSQKQESQSSATGGEWQCQKCLYFNKGPICTHCGTVPMPSPAPPATESTDSLSTAIELGSRGSSHD